MNDQQKVVIGYVLSPHGIKGWLKVISYTDPIDNFFSYKTIFINKENEYLSYDIDDSSASGKTIRIKLSDIDDRNKSEELAKCEILVNREDLPEISSDSYYWTDLIGFEVKNEDNLNYGILDSFIETGSNDVMVVIDSNNRNLIPFINNEAVKSVDLKSKTIIVDWNDEE
jgi:16S rRNA processing protein RimM